MKLPSQHLEVSLFLSQDLDPSPLVVFLEAHSVLRGVVCWLQVSVSAEPHLQVSCVSDDPVELFSVYAKSSLQLNSLVKPV